MESNTCERARNGDAENSLGFAVEHKSNDVRANSDGSV
jgi:hypothetical protein